MHLCPLDGDCRQYGAPWRLHLGTTRWHFALAFRPSDKFGRATRHADGSWGAPYVSSWTTFRRVPR